MNQATQTLCAVVLFALSPATVAYAADCQTALAELNAAVSDAPTQNISVAVEQFKKQSDCNNKTRSVALSKSSALIAQRAQAYLAADRVDAAVRMLNQAPALHWLVQVTRADIAARQNRRAEAASQYNAALDTILDPVLTPERERLSEVAKRIAQLAQENTMLAGTLQGSVKRGGEATGVYKALTRGIVFEQDTSIANSKPKPTTPTKETNQYAASVVQKVFLPIRFGFDQDSLDVAGEAEAKRLAEYIISQKIPRLLLVGHTDDKGSAAYNFDLSKRRTEGLSQVLKSLGVTAMIDTIGKGEGEPPVLSDPSLYDDEQRRAIARRVELVLQY